jgi:hypothetical protein
MINTGCEVAASGPAVYSLSSNPHQPTPNDSGWPTPSRQRDEIMDDASLKVSESSRWKAGAGTSSDAKVRGGRLRTCSLLSFVKPPSTDPQRLRMASWDFVRPSLGRVFCPRPQVDKEMRSWTTPLLRFPSRVGGKLERAKSGDALRIDLASTPDQPWTPFVPSSCLARDMVPLVLDPKSTKR